MLIQRGGASAVPEPAVQAMRWAIARQTRAEVLHGEALTRRITSRPPSSGTVGAASDDVLGREARELLEVVAFGRDEEAVAQGRAVLNREARRLIVTNRSALAARALGDVCLFVVRALEHRADMAAARAQMRECLRLVPDLSASADTHPESVRRLLQLARAADTSPLRVVARRRTLSSCDVLVHGRPLGKLASALRLVPGTYAIQVDCGAPGWIHTVRIRQGHAAHLQVSPQLEQALRWDGPLLTLYPGAEEKALSAQLAELMAWLELSELWIMESNQGRVRVERFAREEGNRPARGASTAAQPADGLPDRVVQMVTALTCKEPGCEAEAPRTSPVLRASMVAVSGLGAAAMLGSWAAWYAYRAPHARLDDIPGGTPEYERTLDKRDQRRNLAIATSSGGAALFAAGAPFWLPERRRVPIWAWSAGAVGMAAASAGAVLWLNPGDPYSVDNCAPDEICTRKPSNLPLAPMLVSQGASLVALPVTYLVRSWTRTDLIALDVAASSSGMQISWSQGVPGL